MRAWWLSPRTEPCLHFLLSLRGARNERSPALLLSAAVSRSANRRIAAQSGWIKSLRLDAVTRMSWLDALSQHPVWTLPPAPPSLDDQDALGDAAAAGTPAAQARAQATISHSASSQSLFGSTARKSTPAAAPPTSPAALARSTPSARSHRHAGTRSATKDRERRLRGARTSNVAVVRGADLVVAVGSELRIASLAQVKANAGADYDEHALAEKDIGEYKVRTSTACGYDMLHGGPPSC